jgi:hypothetical protein
VNFGRNGFIKSTPGLQSIEFGKHMFVVADDLDELASRPGLTAIRTSKADIVECPDETIEKLSLKPDLAHLKGHLEGLVWPLLLEAGRFPRLRNLVFPKLPESQHQAAVEALEARRHEVETLVININSFTESEEESSAFKVIPDCPNLKSLKLGLTPDMTVLGSLERLERLKFLYPLGYGYINGPVSKFFPDVEGLLPNVRQISDGEGSILQNSISAENFSDKFSYKF